MRKYLGIILAMTLILSLAACGGKDTEPDEQQPIPTGIENEETAFHKALVPVKYREEEEVQSTYYKTVFENDEAYYEVQPDGEASYPHQQHGHLRRGGRRQLCGEGHAVPG